MSDHDTHTDPLPTLHGPGSIAEAMERLKTLLDRAEALPPIPPIPVVDVEAVKEQTALILRLQAEAWERGAREAAKILGKALIECDPKGMAFAYAHSVIQNPYFAAPAAKPSGHAPD